MPAPQISPLPTPPSRSQSPETFSADADAFLGALPEFQTDANAQADYLDALAIAVDADAASADADAAAAAASEVAAAASEAAAALSETNAAASEVAAAASESAAAISETNAAASEVAAAASAAEAEAIVAGIGFQDIVFINAAMSPYSITSATNGKLIACDTTGGNIVINLALISGLTLPFTGGVKKTTSDGNTVTINCAVGNTFDDGATSKSVNVPAGFTLLPDTDTSPDVWVAIGFGGATAGPVTGSGLTMSTDKLLGRNTAGTGAIEEIAHASLAEMQAGTETALRGMSPANISQAIDALAGDVSGPASATASGIALYDGTSGKLLKSGLDNGTSGQVLTSAGAGLNPTWASISSAVQFQQSIKSANYTLVLGDAGKQIFHPASDTATRTYTIPSNSSVPFPIGTVVLFTVENNALPVSVAITSDTLVFGSGQTGTIIVPKNNTLMAIKVTATKWMANYLYQTGGIAKESIAVSHENSPYISAYPWSVSGFGTRFSQPSTLPSGNGRNVAFSASGDAIAVAHNSTGNVSAYRWSSGGFGAKFNDPTTPVSGYGGFAVAFNPTGNAVAVGSDISPFIWAYEWSSSGFGSKFANPATLPPTTIRGIAFSPSGDAIAMVYASVGPYVAAYPWSGSGFGTKYADPSTSPTLNGWGVAFSPSGDAIAVAHADNPQISVYPWSASGFGTKFANPSTLIGNTAFGVAFSPAGDAIAAAHNGSPYISAYPWSVSGFGTKYSNPSTLPPFTCNGVAFNPSGNAIAAAHQSSPYVTAYAWSSSGFGSKFTDPAQTIAGIGNSVAFTLSS